MEANFIVSDYYFDSNDYSTPVKTSYNDRFTFYGVQGISKKIEFRMKRNSVSDQSSPFFFFPSKTYEYFSLSEINQEVQSSSNTGTILDIKIVLDNKYQVTSRQVYSLGDMVGQVGGMYSILFTFWSFFVGTISSRIYLNSLISSFYQVHKDKSTKVSPRKLIKEEVKEIPFK